MGILTRVGLKNHWAEVSWLFNCKNALPRTFINENSTHSLHTHTNVGTLVSVCASIKCEWTCFFFIPILVCEEIIKTNTLTHLMKLLTNVNSQQRLIFYLQPGASRARCAATRWERANKDRTAVRFRQDTEQAFTPFTPLPLFVSELHSTSAFTCLCAS